MTPANNAPGYELPGGFTAYSQTDKRERKHTPTAAETGPKAQSSHTRGPKPAAQVSPSSRARLGISRAARPKANRQRALLRGLSARGGQGTTSTPPSHRGSSSGPQIGGRHERAQDHEYEQGLEETRCNHSLNASINGAKRRRTCALSAWPTTTTTPAGGFSYRLSSAACGAETIWRTSPVATIHAVPIAHRKYAEAVPESLRATLSGAELAARCAELERLDRHAAVSGVEVEVTRALASQAKRVATALPICQFIERKREIGHRINGSGSFEVRGAYHALNRQLVEQNKLCKRA